MAPKTKITREEIIEAAFSIVRSKGWSMLTARTVANKLKLSTRPIYHYFKNMDELGEEVMRKIVDLFHEYQSKASTGYFRLDSGTGYIMFAREEPHLFAAMNDARNVDRLIKYSRYRYDARIDNLAKDPEMKGLSREELRYFEFLGWAFVHGLASMKNIMDKTQTKFDRDDVIATLNHLHNILFKGFREDPRSTMGDQLIPNPEKKIRKRKS